MQLLIIMRLRLPKLKKIRFGWFDFIDDYEVSKKLLDKIDPDW